jgi:hypothetical protein
MPWWLDLTPRTWSNHFYLIILPIRFDIDHNLLLATSAFDLVFGFGVTACNSF